MSYPTTQRKPPFLAILSLSALAGGLAFATAFQQDQGSITESARLALGHLLYALQMKDDMAVIDWGHAMERSERLLAFQVSNGPKIISEGGNHDRLTPGPEAAGLAYRFPDQWIFNWRSEGPPSAGIGLTVRYRSRPGPFLWGLFAFLACFLSGAFASWLTLSGNKIRPVTPSSPARSPSPSRSSNISRAAGEGPDLPEGTVLLLDKNFIIQRISAEAARIFEKKPSELLQCHLLDLLPHPQLMRSIERGERTEWNNAFPRHPDISALVEPGPTGTWLHLIPSRTPKNL